MRRRALATALLCGATGAWAQEAAEPFMLGTITLVGQRIAADDGGASVGGQATIGRDEMRKFDRDNIGDALNLLPGVTLATNARNEKTVTVRGFDARQVPLFIDGIPVYVPYDGYVDFNRFTTADLAAIQVAKGFSSVAYGPNALGGAINLVSRKPSRPFEGDAAIGIGAGSERQASANIGLRQRLWYLQAGVATIRNDGFPLSSDFVPTATEDGEQRNNAARKDRKWSVKAGYTPNATDEYALSYYRQDGEKGQPPSTDASAARYWKWPYWDKESLYFVSSTALGRAETLKVRLFRDAFDNRIDSYADGTYARLLTSGRGSVSTGRSIYHDRSDGGSIELESTRFAGHAVRLVGHYKKDEHRELDAAGNENTYFKDRQQSFAIEDNIRLAPAWVLSAGAARHALRPESVFSTGNPYSLPGRRKATNVQAGLFHDLSDTARAYATLARKSRLPTLKDRYSQRLGTYIENPSLRPEESVNAEVGVQARAWGGMRADAAVFWSDITDKIQSVANVSGNRAQMQNVGKARSAGVELGLRGDVASSLELGGTYTFIDLDNRSDPATRLTDVPRHKATAHATWRAAASLDVIAFAEHNSARWASNTLELGGYTTVNAKAAWRPVPAATLEAGVNNLADRNYALADGFPSAGRTWFAKATYRF